MCCLEVKRFACCAMFCGGNEEPGHGVAELAHHFHDEFVVNALARGRGFVEGGRSVGENVVESFAQQR